MGDKTGIEWTDATVNFWWGCTKVSLACDNCYAETWASRFYPGLWGDDAPRRKIARASALLRKLNRAAEQWRHDYFAGRLPGISGPRRRVFIQSMSDLFDKEVPFYWFEEAWGCIEECDQLDIQIVTKRLPLIIKRLDEAKRMSWPRHVGLIVSVVNQAEADRDIPRLLKLKDDLNIPWVGISAEPLLGPIDLSQIRVWSTCNIPEYGGNGHEFIPAKLDWVIIGGESGHGARHMPNEWAESIVEQCRGAGVPVFVKQISSGRAQPIKDMAFFPPSLRVREFPDE